MAKIKLNSLFGEISGTLGDFVIKRSSTGEMIIARRPRKSDIAPSEAQNAHRQRFKAASAYAKAATQDPRVRALYEEQAMLSNKTPYNLAISDYFKGRNLLQK